MRVLIADPYPLNRAGLRRLIEAVAGLTVVAEARDGAEAYEMVALHRPELALLALPASGPETLQAISRIGSTFPETAVVALANHGNLELAREVLARGARGFIDRDATPAELELALRTCAQGHTFLSPALSSQVLHTVVATPGRRRRDELPPRQRQILSLIGEGRSNKQIAALLGLSMKTVETHRARMMETLGLRRANELVHYAVRRAASAG